MRRLLCYLGFHDWRVIEYWRGRYGEVEEWTRMEWFACVVCGKENERPWITPPEETP
jgi:hypothetical protein